MTDENHFSNVIILEFQPRIEVIKNFFKLLLILLEFSVPKLRLTDKKMFDKGINLIVFHFYFYSRFLPDLDDIINFEELVTEADLTTETKEAAK